MNVLLDTHAFLWLITADRQRLSPRAIEIFADPANAIFLSVVSVWEMMLKHSKGKLRIAHDPRAFIRSQLTRNQIQPVALELGHVLRSKDLPPIHKDPFDRMLVAQAIENDYVLMTCDEVIGQYPVKTLW